MGKKEIKVKGDRMEMIPHSKEIRRRIRQLIREAEKLYGKNMDNKVLFHVQEHMVKEGLRHKIPLWSSIK